jgi:hypothetical protein
VDFTIFDNYTDCSSLLLTSRRVVKSGLQKLPRVTGSREIIPQGLSLGSVNLSRGPNPELLGVWCSDVISSQWCFALRCGSAWAGTSGDAEPCCD